jgi:hypothetical protein
MTMKKILYYRKTQYGVEREFVHPDWEKERQSIAWLTGQKTINEGVRAHVSSLTGGLVTFEETTMPATK